MSDPGSGAVPSGSQPGSPEAWAPPSQGAPGQIGTSDAGWAPPQYGPAVEQKTSARRKWLSIGGSVVAVGIVGAGALGLGFGDPEVGDCVQLTSDTEFDVVDCGAGEAEYKIVGIAAEDITYSDYMADDDLCSTVVDTEVVLWFGADADPGTAYCAAGL